MKCVTPLLPVIALQTTQYKHDMYGTIHKPVLKFMRWHDTGLPPPEPQILPSSPPLAPPDNSDMDDELPF